MNNNGMFSIKKQHKTKTKDPLLDIFVLKSRSDAKVLNVYIL